MTRYIASPEHLKMVMGLLRDPSASIQYEAFHVFKIFVANPRKDATVLELLKRNDFHYKEGDTLAFPPAPKWRPEHRDKM